MKEYHEVLEQLQSLEGIVTEQTHRTIYIEVLSLYILNNIGKSATNKEVLEKVNKILIQKGFKEASYYEVRKVVSIALASEYRLLKN